MDVAPNRTRSITIVVVLFLTMLTIGMLNLYSASIDMPWFSRQMRNLIFVLPAFFICAWLIPIKKVQNYSWWIYLAVCLMLAIVFILGKVAGGAQRWLSIGPVGFQPSEFAKLAVAIIVARFFSFKRSPLPYTLRDLLPVLCTVGLVFALIFAQPDFGTAGICLLIALVQLAFIRINLRSLGLTLISLPLIGFFGWTLALRDYQKLRILNLFNPNLDPQNTGYNSLQSLIAIGSGKTFGKGYMMGTQAHLKFLPERHTDFIFSVFAEEHGFWGGAVIFALFALLVWTALSIGRQTRDTFAGMLAVGIAALLFLEFFVNIAMVLGIFPVVGLPLPFFSYGSSSQLTIAISLGLLISIVRSTAARQKS